MSERALEELRLKVDLTEIQYENSVKECERLRAAYDEHIVSCANVFGELAALRAEIEAAPVAYRYGQNEWRAQRPSDKFMEKHGHVIGQFRILKR